MGGYSFKSMEMVDLWEFEVSEDRTDPPGEFGAPISCLFLGFGLEIIVIKLGGFLEDWLLLSLFGQLAAKWPT